MFGFSHGCPWFLVVLKDKCAVLDLDAMSSPLGHVIDEATLIKVPDIKLQQLEASTVKLFRLGFDQVVLWP